MVHATETHEPGGAHPDGSEHELLLVRRGRRTGAHAIVAVHSTVLGPALGGCRLWHYPSLQDAIDDALRLSAAMTLKAAAARLPLGGGKSVIFPPAGLDLTGVSRRALLDDFADTVNMLEGTYITAEDVGTTSDDMAALSARTPYVVGVPTARGGSGDPGDFTAAGVQAAMHACARHVFGFPELAGRTVSLVGVGHVGEPLARRLAAEGAELVLADIDDSRRAVAERLGARWETPEEALHADVDVLAPCALGGVIDAALSEQLRARIICGSANNQLAFPELADVLHERGVLYAPDFIVNSGGLINVSLELSGYDRDLALARVAEIDGVLARILDHAEQEGTTPLGAALELADDLLDAARSGGHAPNGAGPAHNGHRRQAARSPLAAG
jgi:leucine dehydrogenase